MNRGTLAGVLALVLSTLLYGQTRIVLISSRDRKPVPYRIEAVPETGLRASLWFQKGSIGEKPFSFDKKILTPRRREETDETKAEEVMFATGEEVVQPPSLAPGGELQFYWEPILEMGLEDGDYIFEPGKLKFSIDGKNIRSESPFLITKEEEIQVLCIPLSIRVVDSETRRRVRFDFRVFYGRECIFSAVMWKGASFRYPEGFFRNRWSRFFRTLELHLPPGGYVVELNAEGERMYFVVELTGKELRFLTEEGEPDPRVKIEGDSWQGWAVTVTASPHLRKQEEVPRWSFWSGRRIEPRVRLVAIDEDFERRGTVAFSLSCPADFGKPEALITPLENFNPARMDGLEPPSHRLKLLSSDVELKSGRAKWRVSYQVPDLPDGAYLLRFKLGKDLSTQEVVRIHSGKPVSLYLFLEDGRRVFYPGERVELALFLKTKRPLRQPRLSILLLGRRLMKKIYEGRLADIEAGGRTESFFLKLPQLAPSKYALSVRLQTADTVLNAKYDFEVVSRLRSSNMQFMTCYSYGVDWMPELNAVDLDIFKIDAFIAVPPYSRLMSYPYLAYEREVRRLRKRLERSELLSQELLRPFSEVWFAEAFMRRGTIIIPAPIGYGTNMFQNLLHTIKNHELNDIRRMALSTQYFRHIPNVVGFNHITGDLAMPITTAGTGDDYSLGYRLKLLWQKISERYKHIKDPVERAVLRYQDFNSVWPRCLKERIDEIHRIDPQFVNMIKFAGSHQFGDKVRGGQYLPQALQPLEIRLGMENTDLGYPALYGAWEADLFRYGPGERKVVWVTGHYWSMKPGETSYAGRQILHILARKVEGLGFNGDPPFDPVVDDEVRKVREIVRRYGDLFLNLQSNDRVALLKSFTEGAAGRARAYYSRVFEAWTALVRAGYPPTLISEEEILEGKLQNFKVLFVPGQTVQFLRPLREVLEKFVRDGGKIFTDEVTTTKLPGMRRLPVHFDHNWSYQIDGSTEHKQHFDDVAPQVPPLRSELGKIITYPLVSLNPHIMVTPLKGGAWDYFVVVNDTFPQITGVNYQRDCLPVKEKLIVTQKPAVVYDLLEQREVPLRELKGRTYLEADFSLFPARIFVFAGERLGALELLVEETTRAGEALNITARVLSEEGRVLKADIPLQITVVTPSQKAFATLYRSTRGGNFGESLTLPVNVEAGRWELRVRELVTGIVARTSFTVETGRFELPVRPSGDVLVFDQHGISQFFHSPSQKLLLLDVSQWKRLGFARSLVRRLKGSGVNMRLELFNPDRFVFSYQGWRPFPEDEKTWQKIAEGKLIGYRCQERDRQFFRRGFEFVKYNDWYPPRPEVRQDVLLVGWKGESRFIDSILDSMRLRRKPSQDYPGKGKALIQCAWDAFSAGHIALLLLAPDDRGLEKGSDKLLELALSEDLQPDLIPRLLPYPFTKPRAPSRLPSGKPTRSSERSPEPFITKNFGNCITRIVPSADGSRVLVGFNAYGHNLFLLDNEGRTLWKRKVSEFECQDISLSPDGNLIGVLGGGEELQAYAPNNRILFRGKTSKNALILDSRGNPIKRLGFEVGGIDLKHRIFFDRTGQIMLAHSLEGKLLWHYDDWFQNTSMEDFWHKRTPAYFRLSRDSEVLYAGWWGEYTGIKRSPTFHKPALFVIKPATGKLIARIEDLYPTRIALSHNGRYVAVFEDGRSWLERAKGERWLSIFEYSGKKLARYRIGRPVSALAISSKGLCAFSFREKGRIYREIWFFSADMSEPRRLNFTTEPYRLAFSPDGSVLVVSGIDSSLSLLRAQGQTLWRKKLNGIATVAFSDDGKFIFAGTSTGRVYKVKPDSTLLYQRNLSPEVYVEDFKAELSKLKKVPVLRKKPVPPKVEEPLFHSLPEGVEASEELFKGGDFEDTLPSPFKCQGVYRNSPDAYLGRRALLLKGRAVFELRLEGFEEVPHRRRTYLLEFAQKLKTPSTFSLSFYSRARKLYEQKYRGVGRYQFERFAWKLSSPPGRAYLMIKSEEPLLLDEIHLRELRFPSENVAYVPSALESAEEAVKMHGQTEKRKIGELKLYVFNRMVWEGGGRMSRPEKPLLTGVFPPIRLVNGLPYDIKEPIYKGRTWSRKYQWDNQRNYACFELGFPRKKRISIAAIYECNEPGFITREGLVQAWDSENKDWKTLSRYRDNRHAFHIHSFPAFDTSRVRLVLITAGPDDKYFRTTELELYSPEEEPLEELFK